MSSILRMKFWLVSGLVGFAALLIFGIGALPQMTKNSRAIADLRRRYVELQKLPKGPVVNQQWAKNQEQLEKQYQEQIKAVLGELVERDQQLEQYFDDEEMGDKGPLQGGRWMAVYDKKTGELLQELRNSVTRVTASTPLVFRQFGPRWPRDEEMREGEKRYWVQKGIVDAIGEVNKAQMIVPVFESFVFSTKPERYMHPSHKDSFKCVAFQLRVVMEFKNIPVFLEDLVNSPLKPEVTSVSLSRGGQTARAASAAAPSTSASSFVPEGMTLEEWQARQEAMQRTAGGGTVRGATPGTPKPEEGSQLHMVNPLNVVINGYVPDYIQPGEEKKPATLAAPVAPFGAPVPPAAAPVRPKAAQPAQPTRKGARSLEELPGDMKGGK